MDLDRESVFIGSRCESFDGIFQCKAMCYQRFQVQTTRGQYPDCSGPSMMVAIDEFQIDLLYQVRTSSSGQNVCLQVTYLCKRHMHKGKVIHDGSADTDDHDFAFWPG